MMSPQERLRAAERALNQPGSLNEHLDRLRRLRIAQRAVAEEEGAEPAAGAYSPDAYARMGRGR